MPALPRQPTFSEQANLNAARLLRDTAGAGTARPEHTTVISTRGATVSGIGFAVPARVVTLSPYQASNEAERLMLLVLYYAITLDTGLSGQRYVEAFVGFIVNLSPQQEISELRRRMAAAGCRLAVENLPANILPAIYERLGRIYRAVGCDLPEDRALIQCGDRVIAFRANIPNMKLDAIPATVLEFTIIKKYVANWKETSIPLIFGYSSTTYSRFQHHWGLVD